MIPKFRAFVIGTEKLQEVWKMRFYETEGLYINEYYGQDFYLMQSTGKHDKNGVEMFEGDIVKVLGEYGDDLSVVKFESGAFVLDYKNLDTEFELIYSVSLPIKVIGNIYENPELLEV